MADAVTDYAILIDPTGDTITTLPNGTVRAKVPGDGQKIIIGRAPAMSGIPFCNGISGKQFISLPAYPNFPANGAYAGTFVIIGVVLVYVDETPVSGTPTYWGCNDVTELVAQCTVLNGGSNEFTVDAIPYDLDANGGIDADKIANCKLFLDNNGYALSNGSADFLNSYFPPA